VVEAVAVDVVDTVVTATIISKTNTETVATVETQTLVDTVDMELAQWVTGTEEDMEILVDHPGWIIMECSSNSSSKVDMEDSPTKTMITAKSLLDPMADSRAASSSNLTSISSLWDSRALPLIPPVDLEDGPAPGSRTGVATGSKRIRSMLGQCQPICSFF
jgi:hypothetical protein